MTIVDGVLLQLIVTEEGNDFCGGVLELTIVMVLWNGLWEECELCKKLWVGGKIITQKLVLIQLRVVWEQN